MENTTNKTIAKNTLFLYFRMMITMFISLYISRVVLDILGENDFGIYSVVGGLVGTFVFLNNALSTGSSRFLVFELGTGNFDKLKKTFSTVLSMHIILSILFAIFAETIGLWFFYNKLVIPPERMDAAIWLYHLSILTTVVSITQVPYDASIISHERIKIFAYVSLIEVFAKLGIVFLLKIGNFDKLVFYAVLLCLLQLLIRLYYRYYCHSNFKETHYEFVLDKKILKSISVFSGWSLASNLSIALNTHGTVVITNMFFGPAIVTARSISVQVYAGAYHFVTNFRKAVNPQIIKKYASGDFSGSKQLMLFSTKISFYLMFFLGLPIILLAEPLLHLWLKEVPEYSVIFLQLIIIKSLFGVFDTSFYTALSAKGQLRENAMLSPLVGMLQFLTIYLFFKNGFSPVSLSYIGIIFSAVLGLIIKPILLCRIVKYNFRDIMSVFVPCLKISIASIPIPALLNYYLANNLLNFFIICSVSAICTLTVIFYLGIDGPMRKTVICFTKGKFQDLLHGKVS